MPRPDGSGEQHDNAPLGELTQHIEKRMQELEEERELIVRELEQLQEEERKVLERIGENEEESSRWAEAARIHLRRSNAEIPEWATEDAVRNSVRNPVRNPDRNSTAAGPRRHRRTYQRTLREIVEETARETGGSVRIVRIVERAELEGRTNPRTQIYQIIRRMIELGNAKRTGKGRYLIMDLGEDAGGEPGMTLREIVMRISREGDGPVSVSEIARTPALRERPGIDSQIRSLMAKMVRQEKAVKVAPGIYRILRPDTQEAA